MQANHRLSVFQSDSCCYKYPLDRSRAATVNKTRSSTPRRLVHFASRCHRRNNRRDRGKTGPQLLGWGTNNVLVPQLFGRSYQKARNFTASSHRNADFSISVFNDFPGVIPPNPHSGRGNPLPHPTPSPAFGRARGASAPVLGPKPWSPQLF